MCRHDPPRTLHSHLKETRSDRQGEKRSAPSPQRDCQEAQPEGGEHAASATYPLGELSEGNRTDDGTQVVEDCDPRDGSGSHTVLGFEEVWIQILCPMGEKHHEYHERHQEGKAWSVPRQGPQHLSEACRSVAAPSFRLG